MAELTSSHSMASAAFRAEEPVARAEPDGPSIVSTTTFGAKEPTAALAAAEPDDTSGCGAA